MKTILLFLMIWSKISMKNNEILSNFLTIINLKKKEESNTKIISLLFCHGLDLLVDMSLVLLSCSFSFFLMDSNKFLSFRKQLHISRCKPTIQFANTCRNKF